LTKENKQLVSFCNYNKTTERNTSTTETEDLSHRDAIFADNSWAESFTAYVSTRRFKM